MQYNCISSFPSTLMNLFRHLTEITPATSPTREAHELGLMLTTISEFPNKPSHSQM